MGEHQITAEQVRDEVREWAEGAWDPELTVAEWWRRLADAGYSAPMLPTELGGRGYTRDLSMAVGSQLTASEVLGPPLGLGLMLAAPTIAVHGDESLQQRFVRRIVDGTDAWCQLFSEPGAGSDLAGLQCKAVRDGDEFVITGQKVWTSGGQHADWGMLLARTDPEVPKHQGITYFAFDMHQPGVEVRPLREMTGRAMFNEVFIDEARVPVENVIGGLNNGWAVANTTLMVERASIGSGGGAGIGVALPGSVAGHLQMKVANFTEARAGTAAGALGGGTVTQFTALARRTGCIDDPIVRQGLAELYTLTMLNRLNVTRARSRQSLTGVEGNLAKLLLTHTLRRAREIGNQIVGAEGMLWGPSALSKGSVQELTAFSPGPAIYGGTDQIQKNIAAERGLGLPKEPGDLKGVPFSQLPKNG
ncbi:MAG: acyl-CoA dehydrogenase family protein [Actinomycetota bacterium]|nr:MAG: acyl-CoA dehydrogenase family protein [Actinomycetota bacterium]